MIDERKTKAQLIEELQQVRHRVAELELPETGNRQMEDQLRILASVIDQSVNSIAVLNTEGNVEYVNSKLLEPYKISPEEVIGANWRSFLSEHSSLRSKYDEMRKTVLERGEVWKGEVSDKTINGEQIWREATVFPIFDTNGVVTHSVYMSQDITDRRQAERERVRLTAILENTSDLISTAFPDTRLTYLNRAGRDLIGWGDDERLIDKKISDIHPSWAMKVIEREGIPKAIREGIWNGETTIQHIDGTEIPVSQVIMSHKSSDNEIEYLSTIIRDISEHKQTEETLRESEERFRIAVSQIPGTVWTIDTELNFTLSLGAGLPALGLEPGQVVGMSLFEFFSTDDPDYHSIAMHRRALQGESVTYNDDFEGKYYQSYLEPLRTSAGEVTGVIGISFDVTQRKQAEKELRDSEKKFRSIVEQSIDGIALTDEEGYVVEWNPALEKITGINRDQAIGQLLWKLEALVLPDEIRTPEIESVLKSKMQEFLKIGGPPSGEQFADLTIRKPDGETRSVQLSMFPIKTEKGFRGASVMRDVTEHKQAEESRGKLEELLNIAFESSPSAMAITTLEDGKYIIVNPAFTRILGYRVEETIGHTSHELGVFGDYSDRVAIKTELAQSGYVNGYELRVQTKSGDIKDALFSAQVVEFQKEKCLLSTVTDITKRKQAEESLRESEEMIRAMIETSRDWIWSIDLEASHTYSNPAVEAILGYKAEELIEKQSLDHMDEADREKVTSMLPEMINEKRGWNDLLLRWQCKDGSWRYLESNAVPILDREGRVEGFRGIDRDVTERKQAEEVIRESEEKYRSVIEKANIGMIVIKDGKQVLFNPKLLEFLGYSAEEYQKLDFLTTIHPDDQQVIIDRIRQRLIGTSPGQDSIEIRVVTKTGDVKWIRTNSDIIPWEGGQAVQAFIIDITDRKQAEESLRESEERFRALIENSSDGIAILKADGTVEYNGPSNNRILGFDQGEALTTTMFDAIHPDDHTKMAENFEVVLQHPNEILIAEYRTHHKDGTWHVIETVANNLFDDPVVQGIVVNFRDITERKQVEESLRESEERYRRLADNATDIIWTMDMNMRMTYVSPSVSSMRGYSVEEVMEQTLDQIITPESEKLVLDTFGQELEKLKQTGIVRPVELEFEQYHKDGSTIWSQAQMTFLLDSDGEPVGILGVTRDISDRKQAEEEMQKLASVVRYSSELVNISDLNGKMNFLNEAGQNMLGIDPEEIEQVQIMDVIPDNLLELVETELLPTLMNGDTWQGELQYRNLKTGHITDVHATTFPVKDTVTGNALYLANVSLDITERKQAEEKMREAEKLREVDRLRAELLSNVSHELRTPLGSIMGYSSLMLNYKDMLTAEEKHDYLVTITEASKRLSGLVDSLLDMSRMDTGMLNLNMYSTDLDQLIHQVVHDAQVRSPGHEIVVKLPEELPPVVIDSERIRQVLDNIIDNATKYSDAGTRVTITATCDNSELTIETTDQGIGIPTDDHERVFERLYRVTGQRYQKIGGAGLGLSISKGIIEAHGGRIWMKSADQGGTTCSFTLPLIVKEEYHAGE